MIMGMPLETAMQIIWRTSEFFPLINFNGRLDGTYPQIPIISDAAYMHSRFNLGDWPKALRFLKPKPSR